MASSIALFLGNEQFKLEGYLDALERTIKTHIQCCSLDLDKEGYFLGIPLHGLPYEHPLPANFGQFPP
jgi:hypothetical protein